jgi:hypothetical protein
MRFGSELAITVLALIAAPSLFAASRIVTADNVSLAFEESDFTRVEVSERAAKPAGSVPGYEVEPAHLYFHFRHSDDREPSGAIAIYPLRDRRLDIAAAFPDFPKAIGELAQLLQKRSNLPLHRRDGSRQELPTIVSEDAGQIFISHAQYLDFTWGAGAGWLVQYSQDLSPFAVGSRLDYQVSALDRTNRFAVSAFFSVGHPDLPKVHEDEPIRAKNGRDPTPEQYAAYIKRMERFLDRKADNSFRPPLTVIERMLDSIDFGSADGSDWNSRFRGRKVAVVKSSTNK